MALGFPEMQLDRVPWYMSEAWRIPVAIGSYGVLALLLVATLPRVGRRIFLRKRARWQPRPGTIYLSFAARAKASLWALIGTILVFFASRGSDMLPTPAWFPWFVLVIG